MDTDGWSCALCTLHNSAGTTRCAACGAAYNNKAHETASSHTSTTTPPVVASIPLKCSLCEDAIHSGAPMAQVGQRQFHRDCFLCAECGEFAATFGGKPCNVRFIDNMVYHPQCAQGDAPAPGYTATSTTAGSVPTQPLCDVCRKALLPGRENSLVNLWKQQVCAHHCLELHNLCCYCGWMGSIDSSDVKLFSDDKRYICSMCRESVISSDQDMVALSRAVAEFVTSQGLVIPPALPIRLATTQDMLRAAGGSASNPAHREARGLTVAFRGGAQSDDRVNVKEVLVLHDMPYELAGSVLAHELTHVHFHTQGFPHMRLSTCEGLCNLMSYLWLRRPQPSSAQGTAATEEKKAAEHVPAKTAVGLPSSSSAPSRTQEEARHVFIAVLERMPDATYGEGFRAAVEAHLKLGVATVLSHVKLTGVLPE